MLTILIYIIKHLFFFELFRFRTVIKHCKAFANFSGFHIIFFRLLLFLFFLCSLVFLRLVGHVEKESEPFYLIIILVCFLLVIQSSLVSSSSSFEDGYVRPLSTDFFSFNPDSI